MSCVIWHDLLLYAYLFDAQSGLVWAALVAARRRTKSSKLELKRDAAGK